MVRVEKMSIRTILGINSFTGKRSFINRLKRAIVITLMAGTISFVPIKNAMAITDSQTQTATVLQVSLNSAVSKKDDKAIKFVTNEIVKLMFDLFDTLEKELKINNPKEVDKTINAIILLAKDVGLEKKAMDRINDIKKAVKEGGSYNKLSDTTSVKPSKKASEGLDYYRVNISGSGWQFYVSYGPFGLNQDGKIAKSKSTISLKEIDRALKEVGLNVIQQEHAKKFILQLIKDVYPKVFIEE